MKAWLLYFGLGGWVHERKRKGGKEMTEERKQAEQETMAVIEVARTTGRYADGGDALIQVAARSYAEGMKAGKRINEILSKQAPAVA